MRTRIEVGELTAHQWGWLTRHLPESQIFGPGAVRMCVTFTLDVAGTEIDVRHAEMSARDFINLVAQLQLMEAGEVIRNPEPILTKITNSEISGLLRPGAGL